MGNLLDAFGDELTAADFDDYVSPAYRAALRRHPSCRDPNHPGCPICEEEDSSPEEDSYQEEAEPQLPTAKQEIRDVNPNR